MIFSVKKIRCSSNEVVRGVDRSFKKRWMLDNVSMKKARTFFTYLWDFVGRNLFAPEKKRKAIGNNLVPPKVENTHCLIRSF